ncbi:MAG TPA: hypothetical protein VKB53_04760, partial [Gammaproteobacteria bacterium]|nr:hypothetical protein [Gammaproteobacteria bacterium]
MPIESAFGLSPLLSDLGSYALDKKMAYCNYRIAIAPGEPAGIGPDITLMLCKRAFDAELVAIADPDLIKARARLIGTSVKVVSFNPHEARQAHTPGELKILPVSTQTQAQPGVL